MTRCNVSRNIVTKENCHPGNSHLGNLSQENGHPDTNTATTILQRRITILQGRITIIGLCSESNLEDTILNGGHWSYNIHGLAERWLTFIIILNFTPLRGIDPTVALMKSS